MVISPSLVLLHRRAMVAKTKKARVVRTVLNKLKKGAPKKPTKAVAKSKK